MTLEERIRQLEEMNAELEKRLADKDNRIAYLEQQLYGRQSEKRLPINPDALQLSLFSAEIDVQEQQADPERQVFEVAALPPAPIHKCMRQSPFLQTS